MRDPFAFLQIPALRRASEPFAEALALHTLPFHIHEIVFFALLYTFAQYVLSPLVSTWLFPKHYPRHSRAKKVNWDSHFVSLLQAVLVNSAALWVTFCDAERKEMDWEQRIWGYSGACGFVASMALGYFVWDFVISLLYLDVFGLGLLAHAASALTVYSFGFRPFLHYYGSVFILYELSTPFLNFHWFFDKLGMTGTRAQLYNGIALLATFFGCRLVWGTVQSLRVYVDMYHATQSAPAAGYIAAALGNSTTFPGPLDNVMAFATDKPLPVWLAVLYVVSNLVLNSLNWYWFFKMITAVRKRFEPGAAPQEEKEKKTVSDVVGAVKSTAAAKGDSAEVRRRRASLIPDSDELREGRIQ